MSTHISVGPGRVAPVTDRRGVTDTGLVDVAYDLVTPTVRLTPEQAIQVAEALTYAAEQVTRRDPASQWRES